MTNTHDIVKWSEGFFVVETQQVYDIDRMDVMANELLAAASEADRAWAHRDGQRVVEL